MVTLSGTGAGTEVGMMYTSCKCSEGPGNYASSSGVASMEVEKSKGVPGPYTIKFFPANVAKEVAESDPRRLSWGKTE